MRDSPGSLRIVLADDDRAYASALARALTRRGLDVVAVAHDGAAAIAACIGSEPDVAVLDLRMPEIDGRGATIVLRELPAAPAVVLLSAADGVAVERAAAAAGAAAFVAKSDGAAAIEAAIRRVAAESALQIP